MAQSPAFQRLRGFSFRDAGDGGLMRGHVTAAAVSFAGPGFLPKLPSSYHPAESVRI
jgi:hypothetical protein